MTPEQKAVWALRRIATDPMKTAEEMRAIAQAEIAERASYDGGSLPWESPLRDH